MLVTNDRLVSGYILFLLLIILIITSFTRCTTGWSIAGYSLSPYDTTNTVFDEIIDQDSTIHWYLGIYIGDNWCYRHEKYELVTNAK